MSGLGHTLFAFVDSGRIVFTLFLSSSETHKGYPASGRNPACRKRLQIGAWRAWRNIILCLWVFHLPGSLRGDESEVLNNDITW